MSWTLEYYEQPNTMQPAEIFEDELDRLHPKLSGKLLLISDELEISGPRLGGGYIEACHGYPGIWEMRAIFNKWLARELFGFDNERIVLLHGYIKRTGEVASKKDLDKASRYWQDYLKTRRISPAIEEEQTS